MPEGSTARDAKHLEAELLGSLEKKKPFIPNDPSMTAVMGLYMEHLQNLRSPDTAKYHATRMGPWVKQYRASEARNCAAHIIKDMQGHYAVATINRSLGILKKALSLAWDLGMTVENYGAQVKRLPEHNERHIYLDLDQVQKLSECATEEVSAAIWFALLTGCRRGEIMKLCKEDIGADTITIKSGNTKTMKTRTIPIYSSLRPWLKHFPLSITTEGLKSGFRRAREKADMPWLHFHDLRHSCASILLASGADMLTISRILGHTSIKTTERYTHLQTNAQRDALENAFAKITPKITPGKGSE